jgi:hypothetical protein
MIGRTTFRFLTAAAVVLGGLAATTGQANAQVGDRFQIVNHGNGSACDVSSVRDTDGDHWVNQVFLDRVCVANIIPAVITGPAIPFELAQTFQNGRFTVENRNTGNVSTIASARPVGSSQVEVTLSWQL